VGWLFNLISGLTYSLAHSLSFSWLNRWLMGDHEADYRRRNEEAEARSDRRRRQIGLCKAALIAAHPVEELKRKSGVLNKREAANARESCSEIRKEAGRVLMSIYVEPDMGVLREALRRFVDAVERYENRVEGGKNPPEFSELADRFDSLVAAGRREIVRLEGG
jgi:hypothetical protein